MGFLAVVFLFSFQAFSYQIKVIGTKVFRSDMIREQILKKLPETDVSPRQLEQLQYHILSMYRQVGFKDVELDLEKVSNNLLVCRIKEGEQIVVRKLEVSGSKKYSESFLKEKIIKFVKSEGIEPGWIDYDHKEIESMLNPSSNKVRKKEEVYFEKDFLPYDRSIFFKAKDMLEEFYLDHGFLEVEIFGPKESSVEQKHWVNLQFRISEGEQTLVKKINFNGASPKVVEPPIKLGQPVNYYKVEDFRVKIEEYFWNDGYPKAQVESKVDGAEITYNILLGDRVKIDSIEIVGHEITKKQVIQRRMKIKTGDWFSIDKLSESRSKILQSDLFSNVNIDLKGNDLIVEVKERKRNSLDLGVGASFEDGPRLTGIWQHRNIFGRGITFRTRAQVNYPALFYDLPLFYPKKVSDSLKEQTSNYFEGRISTGFLYLKMLGIPFDLDSSIDFNAERELRPAYVLNKAGAVLSFFSQIFSRLRINPQLELEYANFDCSNCKDSNENFSRIDQGVVQQATLRFLSILDYRNDPMLPTKGFAFELNSDFGFGFMESASISYAKVFGGLSFYAPLVNDLTWVFNGKAGGIWNLVADAEVPLFKRFYLGGTNSIRGFSDDQIFPADDPEGKGVSLGGKYVAYVRNEIRFPITGNLDGGVFIDTGELLRDLNSFSVDKLAWGTGFGIRYNTPVGPLMFDVGVRLFDGTRSDIGTFLERFGLHFSIGNSI